MSNPRPAPRRQEWMPNRMFDPATNPFAIQNLLKKEKKEDTPFLLKRDERPVFGYSDDALLKESKIQPVVDFQFDELLDQPVITSPNFHAEVDEQFPPVPVSATDSAEVDAASTISSESSDDIVEQTNLTATTDNPLIASSLSDAEITDDHLTSDSEETTDTLASAADTDSGNASEMTDPETDAEAQADAASADQGDTEQEPVQEPVMNASDNEVTEKLASQSEVTVADETSNEYHETIDAAQVVEPPSTLTEPHDETNSPQAELDAGLSQSEHEEEIAAETELETESNHQPDSDLQQQLQPEPEPEAAPSLNNEAVTQLIEAAREETRVEAHAAGFQEGLEAGLEQAKAEMQAALDEKLAVIDQMVSGLQKLQRDPNTLFEPMKKLAMHLAEQLVRGELTQSAQVIARLVDNCLRELAASGEKAVIVHLNPEDLEQYKPLIAQFGDSLVLRPDALLARGSVRASLDGSVVEDLIDRRIKGLSKSLAQPVASSWRPALATPSAKPTVTPKPATTVAPVTATSVTPAATLDAHDNEHDELEDSDNEDDVMFDDLSDGHIDDTQADRNDETHS